MIKQKVYFLFFFLELTESLVSVRDAFSQKLYQPSFTLPLSELLEYSLVLSAISNFKMIDCVAKVARSILLFSKVFSSFSYYICFSWFSFFFPFFFHIIYVFLFFPNTHLIYFYHFILLLTLHFSFYF